MQKIIWQRRSVEYFFEENQLIRQRGRDCAETTKMAGVFLLFSSFFYWTPLRSLFFGCVCTCQRVCLADYDPDT